MNQENAWRFTLLGALISALPILIVVQLLRIQLNPKEIADLIKQSGQYEGEYRTFYPARGQIYDRWGRVLAGNKVAYEIGAELKSVKNPHTIALTLNLVLGTDYQEIYNLASIKPGPDAVYVVLERNASQEQVDEIRLLRDKMDAQYAGRSDPETPRLDGLVFTSHLQRTYPEQTLASNLIGFVNGDEKGYFGVEEKFNDLLTGKPKTVWVAFDPNQVQQLPNIPDGASLVLTIDSQVQASMEELIDSAVNEYGAESGAIIVYDPKTGEIMAMANTDRMNLNEYWRVGEIYQKGKPFNRGIGIDYEPGSVYKVLTMAAGLDSGAVKPETSFLDTGVFEIGGIYIYNWNGGAWGPQDMQGCMEHSLNVCLSWIATQIGPTNFYRYMQAFGIGRITGVDMAGEVTGRLKTPGDEDWYDADLATNSFGQGVSATVLQMAVATAAAANDGKIMAPHIVRSIINKGYQYDIEQRVTSAPLKPETAHVLTEMLARSVNNETSEAAVEGYRMAGKTGTAEIPTAAGYTSSATNASFVGWGPVDDPRFLVYVWLEKPTTSVWWSEVAAPVFRKAVERLVVLLNIPPDAERQQLLGH
jgi:cell division protein FtsI/penicillin-binding protein 2